MSTHDRARDIACIPEKRPTTENTNGEVNTLKEDIVFAAIIAHGERLLIKRIFVISFII